MPNIFLQALDVISEPVLSGNWYNGQTGGWNNPMQALGFSQPALPAGATPGAGFGNWIRRQFGFGGYNNGQPTPVQPVGPSYNGPGSPGWSQDTSSPFNGNGPMAGFGWSQNNVDEINYRRGQREQGHANTASAWNAAGTRELSTSQQNALEMARINSNRNVHNAQQAIFRARADSIAR